MLVSGHKRACMYVCMLVSVCSIVISCVTCCWVPTLLRRDRELCTSALAHGFHVMLCGHLDIAGEA
jgi:hypothetical protein